MTDKRELNSMIIALLQDLHSARSEINRLENIVVHIRKEVYNDTNIETSS